MRINSFITIGNLSIKTTRLPLRFEILNWAISPVKSYLQKESLKNTSIGIVGGIMDLSRKSRCFLFANSKLPPTVTPDFLDKNRQNVSGSFLLEELWTRVRGVQKSIKRGIKQTGRFGSECELWS